MKKFGAIIIENDPFQTKKINTILSKNFPNIIISDIAKNMKEALHIIRNNEFDIIILDVNFENNSGFELLKKTSAHVNDKELIILSSQEKYALQAFKYVATDYILKPLIAEDIIRAITKALKNSHLKRGYEENKIKRHINPLKILAIPSVTDVKIIPINDIIYLESEGRYTIFHTTKNPKLVSSKNLGEYEKMLINNSFFRIHHSYLANMDFALNIQKKDGAYLEIQDKTYLPISKRKTEPLYRFLGIR
ncbi:LytR/AlgR family response regulator transcription factor [Aquimarina algiphila]|uniref:LytR/AlgR family response regulator transcription factor n=1 Tax=Aquimarina algiphila TaxID=2047982 RepID=UPI00232ADCFE|nr:LytTR family DNA-binding domain-containing protein [Aquimarina algiphila]